MAERTASTPTDAELAAFFLTHPPMAGGDDGAGAGAAGGEGGQGGEAGAGLYDLSSFDPDIRSQVEPAFKQFDANVTRKFQEYNDRLKPWEPYEQFGLHENYEPQYVQQALEFVDRVQDPQALGEWIKGVIDEHGETLGLSAPGAGEGGGDGGDDDELLTKAEVDALLSEKVQQAIQPLQQHTQQQETAQREREAYEELGNRLTSLAEEAKVELSDEDREVVFAIGHKYADQKDAIGPAFKDYLRLIGQTESNLLAGKARTPGAPEGAGGAAASTQSRPKTYEEAREQARERIRQQIHA